MPKGIILFGAMGVGDTTLGKAIAEKLNFPHLDIDDYTWNWDTEIPYTVINPKEQRVAIMTKKLSEHPNFVMSGSMFSIRNHFNDMFELAVFMEAPVEICAERLRIRSVSRWGNRVLPGGDMYENSSVYRDYLECAKSYYYDNNAPRSSLTQHKIWISELTCPVLYVDATKSIDENTDYVVAKYTKMRNKDKSNAV